MDYRVQARVSDVLKHATGLKKLQGIDRKAAQMLFSSFADLELIAVMAAERGDAIQGQLEDENVHYYTFLTIAEILGGKLPISKPIKDLLDFLSGLRGEMSLVLMNLTAESWLEVFLHSLSSAGICDGVFAEIEKDEARHAQEAFKLKIPPVSVSKPLMRQLEKLFIEITRDPQFVLPVIHFAGQNAAAKAAVNVVRAHKKACKHLNIDVAKEIEDVDRVCRDTLSVRDPVKLALNEWEKTRLRLWNDQAGICLIRFNIPWEDNLVKFEAALTQAIAYSLTELPNLNKTIANGNLYQCKSPVIGLRRKDRLDRVFTIYTGAVLSKSREELLTEFSEASKRIKAQPYCTITDWRGYEGLQPAPRAAAVITNVGVYDGIPDGYAPLVPIEGNSFLFTTNNATEIPVKRKYLPWPKWQRVVPISLQIDHRSMDGNHSADMVCKIKEWFKLCRNLQVS